MATLTQTQVKFLDDILRKCTEAHGFAEWAYDSILSGFISSLAVATEEVKKVRLATTGALAACTYSSDALTLTADAVGALANIDSVAAIAGNRILVKNQGDTTQNGIYDIVSLGAAGAVWVLRRSSDFNVSDEIWDGLVVEVAEGTLLGGTAWKQTTADPIELDVSNLVFAREYGMMLLASAQTNTGAKTFAASTLLQSNAAGTFSTTFASAATSNQVLTAPDYTDTIAVLAGAQTLSSKTLTNIVGDTTWVKEVAHVLQIAASTTAVTAGANLSILSANGNGAVGGDVAIDTGTGTTGGVASFGATNAESITLGKITKTVSLKGILDLYNAAGTFASTITTGATQARAVAFPDEAGTVILSGTALVGDVSGTHGATVVDKVKGIAVVAPVAADDGKVASYNHGATQIEWASPLAVVSKRVLTLQAGTKATLNFGGQLDCDFTMDITGVLAPTITTVADGGGGESVTGAGTDVIVIHYTSTVSDVTAIKALFPVGTTSGNITATGGTGANVLAEPGDTHAATPLATGTAGTVNAAAATQDISTGAILPANARLISWELLDSAAFDDGGAGTATLEIGTTGAHDGIYGSVALDGAHSACGMGIGAGGTLKSLNLGATTLKDLVTPSGPNLNTFNLGTAAIEICYYVMA
jgi:hypothetical protein